MGLKGQEKKCKVVEEVEIDVKVVWPHGANGRE